MNDLMDWGSWFVTSFAIFFGSMMVIIWVYGMFKFKDIRWVSNQRRNRIR